LCEARAGIGPADDLSQRAVRRTRDSWGASGHESGESSRGSALQFGSCSPNGQGAPAKSANGRPRCTPPQRDRRDRDGICGAIRAGRAVRRSRRDTVAAGGLRRRWPVGGAAMTAVGRRASSGRSRCRLRPRSSVSAIARRRSPVTADHVVGAADTAGGARPGERDHRRGGACRSACVSGPVSRRKRGSYACRLPVGPAIAFVAAAGVPAELRSTAARSPWRRARSNASDRGTASRRSASGQRPRVEVRARDDGPARSVVETETGAYTSSLAREQVGKKSSGSSASGCTDRGSEQARGARVVFDRRHEREAARSSRAHVEDTSESANRHERAGFRSLCARRARCDPREHVEGTRSDSAPAS